MSGNQEWSHAQAFSAELISAPQARQFARLHLETHGLPHLIDVVCLAVSELATNAVVHAQTPFTLTVLSADGSLVVELRDASPAPPLAGVHDVLAEGGRGLLLVQALSREWGTRADADGAKVVWAAFSTFIA